VTTSYDDYVAAMQAVADYENSKHDHTYIELSEGRISEFVCGCGRYTRVKYKGAYAILEEEGDNYYDIYQD
jgi:hypothetical protein